MGYPSSSGEPTVLAVGLIVCLILIAGFITVLGFLFADLRAAQGANKRIERRMNELKYQYEVVCRKEDYQ